MDPSPRPEVRQPARIHDAVVRLLAATSLTLVVAASAGAEEKKKGYTYVIPFDEIPPAPALPPEEALKTFRIDEDFELQVVASDPAIQNPVSLTFDGDGRMWVVEMRGYMPNVEAEGEEEPVGRISILSDKDGDGHYEDYKVFMDELVLPRSVVPYRNGILYAGHEALSFVENVNDQAGEVTVIDPEYAGKGNVEHRANGLLRGLDNWIYNVKSKDRYREVDGKWIKDETDFRGQWGMSQNNYGRLVYNENWFGLKADQLMPDLLNRNPNYPKGFGNGVHLSYRDPLYPARITPGVNRGGEGAIDENGYLTAATAACGPLYYRGDQFPEEYRDTGFFCEPAAHLIRMIQVKEDEAGLMSGTHPYSDREFLASTDERFRPVNLFNAPDGTVYAVDLYHGIVQHRHYLTKYLREHIEHRDLASHPRLGRVYRIKFKGRPRGERPQMLGKKPANLVSYLAHPNGWWRDMAQQLIIDSGDRSVVPGLLALAGDTARPLGQIHALWTLEGLGAIDGKAVSAGLAAKDPHVLEAAIRLSEELSSAEVAGVMSRLENLTEHQSPIVQRQLAASLGGLVHEQALVMLRGVLESQGGLPYVRELAIHGLEGNEATFKELLGETFADRKFMEYLTEALRPKTTAARFRVPKDRKHLESFRRGEEAFVANCMACHGVDGMGLENVGPPLVKSEWVTGSPQRLAAILLQGLQGPIKVAGKTYQPAAPMPGLKVNPHLSDGDLADIATFVRFAWGNGREAVQAATFKSVREKLGDRDALLTPEEASKMFP